MEKEKNLNFEQRISFEVLHDKVNQIKQSLNGIVIGQERFIDLLIIALLSDGHVLIEGVPGIAKTLTAKLLAKTIDSDFSRLQFTPDLMPSDVTGSSVFNAKNSNFEFKQGPVFAHLVLIDEINRAPAKTQSALFEVMEERQITIDGHTYPFERPFMIMATQNPIEQEGTYALPEAQLDRFLLKIKIDYPDTESEFKILKTHQDRAQNNQLIDAQVEKLLDRKTLIELQNDIKKVIVEEHLLKYIAQLIDATRTHSQLYLGASPRASLAIMNAAKTKAAISGRDFVTPEDIKYIAPAALNHRIILTPEKEIEGVQPEEIIEQITHSLAIPR